MYIFIVHNYDVSFFPQTREQFSKSQTGVQVDGVSEMLASLRMTSNDATKYSGDLLAVMEMLKNTSQVFKSAGYSLSDVEVNTALRYKAIVLRSLKNIA